MPFAPATLAEDADACYVGLAGSHDAARYMTMTFDCTPKMRAESPAAVHVDGTARPQVVSREDNPDFHAIVTAYRRRTGLGTVVNTSFNMHEEPIVCSPRDAVRAFVDGRLDYLALGRFLAVSPQRAASEQRGSQEEGAAVAADFLPDIAARRIKVIVERIA